MAKDGQQRPLSLVDGAPVAVTDATHVDSVTVPLADSGAGSPGNSLLASPANHVHPASSPPGDGSWIEKYGAIGAALLGLADGQASVTAIEFGYDFNLANWVTTGTMTGPDTTTGAGTWKVTSNGVVAGTMVKVATGTTVPSIIPPGNTKWYMACRFKTPATGVAVNGIVGATGSTAFSGLINVGIHGTNGNAAFKGGTSDGTAVDVTSTISNDGAYHIHQLYALGDGKVYYKVDAEAAQSVADTHFPAAACGPFVFQDQGDGSTGNHTLTIDWQLFVTPVAA